MRRHKSFTWQSIWKIRVPLRVAFFLWYVALGNTLTVDYLRRRGLIIMDWGFLCKSQRESVAYLFLHCAVAWELWSLIFCLFEVSWVMPYSVMELLLCWKRPFGTSNNVEI